MIHKQLLHVAIIPDGNRRWARKNALKVWKGHEKGARRIRELAYTAFENGVTHLSIWGSSIDNLTKRSQSEREALVAIYIHAIKDMLKPQERERMAARVHIIGRWREFFPKELQLLITELEDMTAQYTERTLTVFLAYSGDDEMLDTVARMVKERVEVTKESLKTHLWTRDIPAVDLMIRTGGEPHLSAGFLMWDMANTFLHFTNTLFPDFTAQMLTDILTTFQSHTRRFGK